MIEMNEIFSDSDKRLAIWCEGVADTNDLAMMCEHVVSHGVPLVSVPPEVVSNVWAYLEKNQVKILTRYSVGGDGKNADSDMFELGAKITSVCKSGASGVQIFVKMRDLEQFLSSLQTVRDDLFFCRDLCIGLDTEDLDINNLDFIFRKLREIRANALILTLDEDTGFRSDFVGRIYAILQNFDFDGELHFILGNNFDRIDQVVRLTECLRPELSERLRFFLDY